MNGIVNPRYKNMAASLFSQLGSGKKRGAGERRAALWVAHQRMRESPLATTSAAELPNHQKNHSCRKSKQSWKIELTKIF